MTPETMTDTASTTIVREIEIRARAAKIFAAITEPDQLTQWWGTDDTYRCTGMEVDFRVGGKWRTVGRGTDGKAFAVEGEYRVIDPPRVLEYTWRHDWGDRPNNLDTIVRYELDERDGVTHLRVVHSGFVDMKSRDDHDGGWVRVLGWLRDFVE
jgi:uncharacterized protein YndB with AHSA1/START domain